jgi:hypothetical protein
MLYAVQHIGFEVPFTTAFTYIANPLNLVNWTNAFKDVQDNGKAKLATPDGEVDIKLETTANASNGVVDWKMTFPDGSVGIAQSRVVALTEETSAYSFTLTPPPAPLEMLEGALAQQSEILGGELVKLKGVLEA